VWTVLSGPDGWYRSKPHVAPQVVPIDTDPTPVGNFSHWNKPKKLLDEQVVRIQGCCCKINHFLNSILVLWPEKKTAPGLATYCLGG
jgi:hypothetical protein